MLEVLRAYLPLPFVAGVFLVLAALSLLLFWFAIQDGRELRRTGVFYSQALLSGHKGTIRLAYTVLFLAVLVLEIGVRLYGSDAPSSTLLKVHWAFDALFVLSTVLTLYLNGTRSQYWHRRLAPTTIVLLLAVAGTGAVPFWKLFF